MSEENNKNLILDVLKQHPEGLTISSIAEKSGLHRHTSRKYVNELIDMGKVAQRFVGVARLCYLNCVNEVNEEKKTEKESFFKRFNIKLMLSVVLISLLLSEVVISAYENNSFNETMTSNLSNTSAMTASMIINESNISNIIEATIDNASNRTVGTNDSLMPATDMSTVPVDNSASTVNASETSENISDNLTNQSVTDNSTISWILNDSNITDIIDNVSKEIENISLPSQNETRPEFSIDLEYPQMITRGETFTVSAHITNIGSSDARSIEASIQSPDGLRFVSGSSNCDYLKPSDACNYDFVLESFTSASLGSNDLKVVINYEG